MNMEMCASEPVLQSMQLRKSGINSRGARDWAIARFIRLSAWLSIAIMFLILIFIAKEALPLFYDPACLKEVGWSRLFLPQHYGTPEAPLPYSWHPVSTEPKYSLMPLLQGTLKVTLIAMWHAGSAYASDSGSQAYRLVVTVPVRVF